MLRAAALLALLICAACTTDASPPPAAALTPAPGAASIQIARSSDLLYLGAPASIDVNGANVASLSVGQSYAGSLRPGAVTLSVSTWSAPGRSSFAFTAEAGKVYRFRVSPRGEQTVAGLAGGIVGQALESSGPFGIAPAP